MNSILFSHEHSWNRTTCLRGFLNTELILSINIIIIFLSLLSTISYDNFVNYITKYIFNCMVENWDKNA